MLCQTTVSQSCSSNSPNDPAFFEVGILRHFVRERVFVLFMSVAMAVCYGCRQAGKLKNEKTESSSTTVYLNPPVGKVDDDAGFFVEVLSPRGIDKAAFNLHQGLSSFDEPCKGEAGKVVDCILDAEESSLAVHPFSLHYHVPSSMCVYVSVEPFYFLNRKTKLTNRLTKYIDSSGEVGIDNDKDGNVDSQDFGCFTAQGEAVCCVGEYAETTFSWDALAGKYGSPVTKVVKRTIEQCIGGPGAISQPKTGMGVPVRTFRFVQGRGASDEYKFGSLLEHGVGPGWVANYFDPAQHNNKPPQAFDDDIDPGAGEEKVGNPYYIFACHDAAFETLASIRVQIREWNTRADFEGRRDNPANHDESGAESDPWSDQKKNDWPDWLDFETSQIKYPDFSYK